MGRSNYSTWHARFPSFRRYALIRIQVHTHQTTPVDALSGFAFSAGLAQGQPGESVWEAARRADLALYAAKRAGKGRVLGDGTGEES